MEGEPTNLVNGGICLMAHNLQAIIARTDLLKGLSSRFEHARIVVLTAEFGMVPMLPAFYDRIQQQVPPGTCVSDLNADGFLFLSANVWHLLAELSRDGPVAYVETGYFGGTGTQSAVAWEGGNTTLGPVTSEEIGPINRALAAIGVARDKGLDEFDTVGLCFFRHGPRDIADECFQEGYIDRAHAAAMTAMKTIQARQYGLPRRSKPWWRLW